MADREPSFSDGEDDGGGTLYSIDVAVRVRPLNHMETNEVCTVRCLDDRVIVVLDPSKIEGAAEEDYLRVNRSRERRYAFDHAFDEKATQADVHQGTTQKLIPGIMDGFNASCFAYGATGAGKTHTMLGNVETPGCMVLTVGELFERIAADDSKVYRVYLTYLEVYNENIRDLLNPGTGYLDLREDPVKGCTVAGITEFTTTTVEETMELLHKGNMNRSVEPTKKNETSSRSHAVMQIMVEGKEKTTDISEQIRVGKLSLIDLAGSERASATDNRGARLVEGANINRSLLALANCINALASESEAANRAGRNGKRRIRANFVPYRDSKLTRLLKDSFGGNCRTVMITNISPAGNQYEETVNSLKYANRAKDIKTKVVQNVIEVDHHVVQYQNVIRELKMEVMELKSQLQRQGPTVLPNIPQQPKQIGRRPSWDAAVGGNIIDRDDNEMHHQPKQDLDDVSELSTRAKGVFKERAKLLKKLIEIEESIYVLKIDVAVKGVQRRKLQSDGSNNSGSLGSLEREEAELHKKISERETKASSLLDRLQENDKSSKEVQQSMKKRVSDSRQLERLSMMVRNYILEVQNIELQLRDRANEQLRDRIITEVGKEGNELQGFLPKIEIGKRPNSPSRKLFTPSSKAPSARQHLLGNGAEMTSSRVYQMGSRLGSIAFELDEDPGFGPEEAVISSPASPDSPMAFTPVRQVAHETPKIPYNEENVRDAEHAERDGAEPEVRTARESAKRDSARGARQEKRRSSAGDGIGGAGGPQIILNDKQMDRYKERLQQRQEMMKKQRQHSDKKLTPEDRRKSPASQDRKEVRRHRTPDRPMPERGRAGRDRRSADPKDRKRTPEVAPRSHSQDRDAEVGGVRGSAMGLNLEKTEIRNVMKPLQAESQVERFAELQERYNLGKQNAVQKRRARNKLMKIQAKHVKPEDDVSNSPGALESGNPYEKPRHAAPRKKMDNSPGDSDKSPFEPKHNMAIANGFSHNQKLAKDNPYAEKGSGLNHNQNYVSNVIRPAPPRASDNPYLAEAHRHNRARGHS